MGEWSERLTSGRILGLFLAEDEANIEQSLPWQASNREICKKLGWVKLPKSDNIR